MAYLFERKENENIGVDYIHSKDNMMITWTYQHLMDLTVANYGRPVTEIKLRKALKDQLDMAFEDMNEGFDLCKVKMIEESNKEWVLEECVRQWNENQKEFWPDRMGPDQGQPHCCYDGSGQHCHGLHH